MRRKTLSVIIQHLAKSFAERQVLKDISLEIDNEVFALLGPNGSGKTTLANALNSLAPKHWRKIFLEDSIESLPDVPEGYHQVRLQVPPFGGGNSTLSKSQEIIKLLHRSPDYLFLGEIQHANEFDKRCSMCGECLLDIFGGICPITRCPKSMLNGPCGGVHNGKCEINKDMDCIWTQSIALLKNKQKQQNLQTIQPPKDWSQSLETHRCI